MKRNIHSWSMAAVALLLLAQLGMAQEGLQRIERDDDADDNESRSIERDYRGQARIDRYLDADVWTDRDDGEYYDGDRITISYRASRDAFVAIYSIDSRGRVNLLFPAGPGDDNYVVGGVTYSLPGRYDDYDLEVSGPEGREHIQIVASRERFPVPRWWGNSGLVCDWDSREEYMEDLNERYFVRYPGQRFAYDRAVIFVNEWEPEYYRPVYWPSYPGWSVCGNVYIDYPYGGSVYINGIYWGCAPLYVPRVVVGWHTITIYDRWGSCWESDFHVSRYNTIVFNHEVIRPSRTVVSKYKEVREVGYRNPVQHGYPKYVEKSTVTVDRNGQKTTVTKDRIVPENNTGEYAVPSVKKHMRGSAQVVKTDRGFETVPGTTAIKGSQLKSRSSKGYTTKSVQNNSTESSGSSSTVSKGRKESAGKSSGSESAPTIRSGKTTSSGSSSGSGGASGSSSEKPRVQAGKKTSGSDGSSGQSNPPPQKGSEGGYKKGGDSGSKSGGEGKGKGKP